MKLFSLIIKIPIKTIVKFIYRTLTILKFYFYKVEFTFDFITYGQPYVSVSKLGTLKIGSHFQMNNNFSNNVIGRQQKCIFVVVNSGKIIIGDNVGISSSSIVSNYEIVIENNVIIGGNTCIYDTDFHPVNYKDRIGFEKLDKTISKPVYIKKNVFIGAHSTILKGVTIGENSVIGACSVVTKDVPANQVWAGNPAKFLKNLPE